MIWQPQHVQDLTCFCTSTGAQWWTDASTMGSMETPQAAFKELAAFTLTAASFAAEMLEAVCPQQSSHMHWCRRAVVD